MKKKRVENREFANSNKRFRDACAVVGIEPTRRQASKWRQRKGLAYRQVVLKVNPLDPRIKDERVWKAKGGESK